MPLLNWQSPSKAPWHDPNDEGNSPRYHNGKICVEPGCTEPAGTYWSPIWCQHHNAIRMDKLKRRFNELEAKLADREGKMRRGLTEG